MTRTSDDASPIVLAGSLFEVALQLSRGTSDGPGVATPRVAKGTRIAIKRVARHLEDEPLAKAELLREAGFLALVNHRAFPRVLDVDQDQRGIFVVEEWVAGSSLDQLLERHSGALPAGLALQISRALTSTMIEIHALADADGPLAVVHGDPSPGNVLWDGTVRLVDFGAAHARGSLSRESRSSGTLPYAAPELCRGEMAPSQATDVYATAAIVARLLIDTPLSEAPTEAARLMAVANHGIDPGLLSTIAPSIRTELEPLLAFRPTDRHRSLDNLLKALASTPL